MGALAYTSGMRDAVSFTSAITSVSASIAADAIKSLSSGSVSTGTAISSFISSEGKRSSRRLKSFITLLVSALQGTTESSSSTLIDTTSSAMAWREEESFIQNRERNSTSGDAFAWVSYHSSSASEQAVMPLPVWTAHRDESKCAQRSTTYAHREATDMTPP